jgi:hypothetical protein
VLQLFDLRIGLGEVFRDSRNLGFGIGIHRLVVLDSHCSRGALREGWIGLLLSKC